MPPIPTAVPSAIASARAGQDSKGGMEREVVGMAWMRSKQCRLFCAALVILMVGQVGSDSRIQVGQVDLGITGKSDLHYTDLPPKKIMRLLNGRF